MLETPGQQRKGIPGLNAKQLISIRAYQLLNITVTKTGTDLIKRLSSLFNDVYNQRLPKDIDDNESMLSLYNSTGYDIFIDNLSGIEVILLTKNDKIIFLVC
jgi:hypothetical protein